VEETGQLDIKINGYNHPRCVVEKSLNKSLDYVIGFRCHGRMYNGIVVGRGKPLRGHEKMFQHAMNDTPAMPTMTSNTSTSTTSNKGTIFENTQNKQFIDELTNDELKNHMEHSLDEKVHSIHSQEPMIQIW
jgi:hypothetical protein